LLLALRLSVGLALTTLLVLFGFYNLRVSNVANLAGLGALGAAFGWKIPHFVMARLVVGRRRAIERGLPDAIELLVISVEAGRSLEDAISRIIPELRRAQPAMAEELEVTGADLRMLPNSDAALRRMADRIDLPSIRSVIITLSQTLKYGTPLAQALRVVAAELRNDGLRKLEEQANRMPVLLTIPMMLFILPSIFMIIGGPAFLTVLNAFNR
jgi:tight adherence protein C